MDKPNKLVSQLIAERQDELARISVDRQLALQPEFWQPMNQDRYQKSIRDAGYHLSYLAESLAANDPALFLDYTAWVKILFAGLNFPAQALTAALECTNMALREVLLPDMVDTACSFVDAALAAFPQMPATVEPILTPESPFFQLATNYLNLLFVGDRQLASRLILDAVEHGAGIKDIYLHVFQPCQQEAGRLWQMNHISVGQEHYCSIATQIIMSQISSYIVYPNQRIGRRLVATSVGGELHEIGIRMVADFLEMEGWDSYYLGANTPAESIIRSIEERHADVLAISATITFHISKVADLINRVRLSPGAAGVKIMVGGYPFNIAGDLWRHVGADGYARDAQDAVAVANRLAGT